MAGLADLREAALACRDSVEQPHFGAPAFRVDGRIFAQIAVRDWQAGGEFRAILKLEETRRMLLCEAEPAIFSPCVWGRNVSLFVKMDAISAGDLAALVQESWRVVAPGRLQK